MVGARTYSVACALTAFATGLASVSHVSSSYFSSGYSGSLETTQSPTTPSSDLYMTFRHERGIDEVVDIPGRPD